MLHQKTLRCVISAFTVALLATTAGWAADALPQNIPLQNPGFEDGLTHWSIPAQFKDQASQANSPVHGGNKAVKIDASQKTNMPFIGNVASGLAGSATYQFSVWARVAPGSPAVDAGVKMENYNDDGKNTSGKYGRLKLPANGEWKQLSVTSQVDVDTTRSNLLLRVFGKGTVIFDDATFALVKNPPEVTVSNNQMMVVTPNRAHRITYNLFFLQAWDGDIMPEVTSNLRPIGTPVDSPDAVIDRPYIRGGADKHHFSVTVNIPKLAPGDYLMDLGYRRDGKFLQTNRPVYIFTSVPNRKPANLTDTGTILWHGKPFFPIGMYHVSSADFKALADNGFNAIQGTSSLDMDAFKKSLDDAQKHGLAVDVPFYGGGKVKDNLENSLAKIKQFADHPAVLCWKIKDEPDIASNENIAIEVPAAYRAFKTADPNHPIELTLAHDATLGFWSNFSDIVQIDRYPVRSSTGPSNLTPVASFSRNAKSVMEPWQNLTFDVQCGWTLDLSTQPTVAQARSMVYLALVSGAKGIFWYSMHEGSGWDLTKTPLWPHMKDINAEIKSISQPIMLGEYVPVQTSGMQVYVTGRKYQNKLYIYFTNPTERDVDVTFRPAGLPELSDGSYVKTAFTDSKTKIKVEHAKGALNNIALKLKGLETGTLVFDIPKK